MRDGAAGRIVTVTERPLNGRSVIDLRGAIDRDAVAGLGSLARLHAMLGQANRCIARVDTRDALWSGVCRAAVEQGGFSVAWVGLLDESSKTVTSVSSHGDYLLLTPFSVALQGADAMGRAVSSGRAVVTEDPADEARLLPRCAPDERAVVRAVAVVPFRCRGDVVGALTLGSAETALVGDEVSRDLLDLLADDISYALEALDAVVERQRADRVDAHQRALSDATLESLPGIFYLIDTAGRFVRWNSRCERVSGYSGAELARLHATDLFAGDEKELVRQRIDTVFIDGQASVEAHLIAKDGVRTPFYLTGQRVMLAGEPYLVGVGIDIAARRHAEESLRALANAVNSAGDVVFVTDIGGTITHVNERFTALYGHEPAEVVGKVTPRILKSGCQSSEFYRDAWSALLGGERVHGEVVNRTKDGRLLPVEETITPYRDDTGRCVGFIAVQREIGARIRAQAESRLLQAVMLGVGEAETLDDALAFVLREVCAVTGWAIGELWVPTSDGTRLDCHPVWHGATPALREFRDASRATRFGPGEGLPGRVWRSKRPEWLPDLRSPSRFPRTRAAAAAGLHAGLAVPVLAHGEVVMVLGFFIVEPTAEDASRVELIAAVAARIGALIERRQAQDALARREAFFRALIENASDFITVLDLDGAIRFQGQSVERLLGFRQEEMVGRSALEWVHPDDLERVIAIMERVRGGSDRPASVDYRVRHADGRWRTLESIVRRVVEPAGTSVVLVNSRDVTASRRLEEQLHHSQRMEAIGRLAGGVAHDLNNALAVIMMESGEISTVAGLTPPVRHGVEQIAKTVEHAVGLTRQLLLFSRKQVTRLRDLDLNASVQNLVTMLQRIIGADVHLEAILHPEPLWVRADAAMLEQVVLNLAVNARDAMPAGGHLRIETARLVDDDAVHGRHPETTTKGHVALRVSDTGEGIAADVIPHIFEPFFTTKGIGQGTGLGLATVFGIVEQHGGWIEVDSTPGRGTTFVVALPAHEVVAEEATPTTVPMPGRAPSGGTETILLVEDDPAVRAAARTILTRNGYRVLAAASGVEAMAMWPSIEASVALILTDLVMPGGIGGRDVAERTQASRPGLPVVLMTGYSPELAGRTLSERDGAGFLQKPFTRDALLETVRRSLDECRRADG